MLRGLLGWFLIRLKRLPKQTPYPTVFILVWKNIYAVNDAFGIQVFIRAQQTIPNRKYIPIVTIRIRKHMVVMDFVHMRSYQHITKPLFKLGGQVDVGVVKLA